MIGFYPKLRVNESILKNLPTVRKIMNGKIVYLYRLTTPNSKQNYTVRDTVEERGS